MFDTCATFFLFFSRKVNVSSNDLLEDILEKIKEFAKKENPQPVVEVLKRVTQYYRELPDDDCSTVHTGSVHSTPISAIPFEPVHDDPFDDVLASVEDQLLKDKQSKAARQHVISQVERNMENIKVGQMISHMAGGAIKNITKKADVSRFTHVLRNL